MWHHSVSLACSILGARCAACVLLCACAACDLGFLYVLFFIFHVLGFVNVGCFMPIMPCLCWMLSILYVLGFVYVGCFMPRGAASQK